MATSSLLFKEQKQLQPTCHISAGWTELIAYPTWNQTVMDSYSQLSHASWLDWINKKLTQYNIHTLKTIYYISLKANLIAYFFHLLPPLDGPLCSLFLLINKLKLLYVCAYNNFNLINLN